jgi:UDP-4-amino-4,6-dideoxy-N-acetyl-beta-L-altrosamine N-acetyltransferase
MNIVISGFGIHLKRIEECDLELIRFWRNSDYVKQYMAFRDYISPEMQLAWFKRIDNKYNHYFLIIVENTPVGLANIKDIDYEEKRGENGIFLSSPELVDGDLGVRAIILLLDFAFNQLGLTQLHQTIIKANRAAQNLNKHLGVNIVESDNGISKGILLKNDYFSKTNKIRKFLNK